MPRAGRREPRLLRLRPDPPPTSPRLYRCVLLFSPSSYESACVALISLGQRSQASCDHFQTGSTLSFVSPHRLQSGGLLAALNASMPGVVLSASGVATTVEAPPPFRPPPRPPRAPLAPPPPEPPPPHLPPGPGSPGVILPPSVSLLPPSPVAPPPLPLLQIPPTLPAPEQNVTGSPGQHPPSPPPPSPPPPQPPLLLQLSPPAAADVPAPPRSPLPRPPSPRSVVVGGSTEGSLSQGNITLIGALHQPSFCLPPLHERFKQTTVSAL